MLALLTLTMILFSIRPDLGILFIDFLTRNINRLPLGNRTKLSLEARLKSISSGFLSHSTGKGDQSSQFNNSKSPLS